MEEIRTHARQLSLLVARTLDGRLTGGALRAVALTGVSTVLTYVVQVMIARLLGPERFGTYSYVLVLVAIARITASLSLEMAAVRYVSIYYAAQDWTKVKGFLWLSRIVSVVAALTVAAASAIVIQIIKDTLPPEVHAALIVGCLLLLPLTLLMLEGAALQAFRLIYEPRIPYGVIRPIVTAGTLLVAMLVFGREGTAALGLAANLMGLLVALSVCYVLVKRRLPPAAVRQVAREDVACWSRFCLFNVGQNVVYFILSSHSDVVVVGSIVGTTQAGYYSAATQVASVMMLGVLAVNQFVAPSLAGASASKGDAGLVALLRRTMLMNLALSLPLIALVVGLGPFLLGLFGPTFLEAYPVIVLFSIGCVASALFSALWGDLLTMRGLYRQSTMVVVASAGINVVLTLTLVPRMGIVGAAMATTAATLVRSVLLCIVGHRHFGFWPWTILFARV